MLRATRILPAGTAPGTAADRVVLDYDQRHRRRMAMTCEGGLEFLLDLAGAVALRDGDLLVLDDGRTVAVSAAPEPLVEIRAGSAADLLRVAWHLGNRHLPTQLDGDRICIRRDHVIEEMIAGLGGRLNAIAAPFDPEGGAYQSGGRQDHGHGHDHAHEHGEHHEHDDRLSDAEG